MALILLLYAAIFVGSLVYVLIAELVRRIRAEDTIGLGFIAFPAVSYTVARNELVCIAGNGAELRIAASEILSWSPRKASAEEDCVVLVRNRPMVFLPCAHSCDVCPHLMRLAPAKLRVMN